MNENLEFLYFLRNQIDQKIYELDGKRRENESLETINNLVKDSFGDIVMMLGRGENKDALEYAERWSKRKWL